MPLKFSKAIPSEGIRELLTMPKPTKAAAVKAKAAVKSAPKAKIAVKVEPQESQETPTRRPRELRSNLWSCASLQAGQKALKRVKIEEPVPETEEGLQEKQAEMEARANS